jgi:hypothetical protein
MDQMDVLWVHREQNHWTFFWLSSRSTQLESERLVHHNNMTALESYVAEAGAGLKCTNFKKLPYISKGDIGIGVRTVKLSFPAQFRNNIRK